MVHKIRTGMMVLALLWGFCTVSYGSETGTWSLSEDGSYWMYYYSPDDPAKDEWIVEDEKEYYVDSKGRMKTGWFTDKKSGERYYLGEDGAKCYNTYTPDGHYVGQDGAVLKEYDTYRKTIEKQLQKLMKDKAYKALDAAHKPGFRLMDLNGDDYRDVVVVNRQASPSRVVLAAVWSPNEGKLVLSAEGDLTGDEESCLMYNQETLSMWMTVTGTDRSQNYFELKSGGSEFENIWYFEQKRDDWGDPLYYVNGQRVGREEWDDTRQLAAEEMGSPVTDGFLVLNEEQVNHVWDQMTEEELLLWRR